MESKSRISKFSNEIRLFQCSDKQVDRETRVRNLKDVIIVETRNNVNNNFTELFKVWKKSKRTYFNTGKQLYLNYDEMNVINDHINKWMTADNISFDVNSDESSSEEMDSNEGEDDKTDEEKISRKYILGKCVSIEKSKGERKILLHSKDKIKWQFRYKNTPEKLVMDTGKPNSNFFISFKGEKSSFKDFFKR